MTIRIGIGAGLGAPLSIKEYWRWVKLCEALGIDSIWHSDHLLRPSLEPMVMLAALAARTKALRFGMNAMVVSHRDPLIIAKQCATIDHLAPGRLLPVFGVGNTSDPIWAATGRSAKGRGARANEAIVLIRRLLTEDNVTFEGEHFRYQGASISPRPARPIPLWIGGESEAAIQRTAELGDGWLGGLTGPQTTGEVITRIKAALKDTGRHIDEDHYGVVIPYRIGELDDPEVLRFRAISERRAQPATGAAPPMIAVGSMAAVVDVFRAYVEAGISKFVAIPLASNHHDLRFQTEQLARGVCPNIEDR